MSLTLEITGLAYGGSGIGRDAGKVVFVPFTAPGDVIEAEVTKEKKRYSEARLRKILTPSPIRDEPLCPVYSRCGGCDLQHIRYSEQVLWKERIFSETLKRIGGLILPPLDPPVPSESTFHYRSKVRFHVKGGRWGFFRKGTVEVVDISGCPIADPLINSAFTRIRSLIARDAAMKSLEGYISSVEIGVSPQDERVVASITLRRPLQGIQWASLLSAVDLLKGLEAGVASSGGRGRVLYKGGDRELLYKTRGLTMSAPLGSFAQINRAQNERLIERVLDYASLKGDEKIIELFCGAGNLTFHLAPFSARLQALDSDEEAIRRAGQWALAANGAISGLEFVAMESARWLEENLKKLETSGVNMVVLDPPREGDSEAIELLSRLRPSSVIYVSCSPPTMARDLKILAEAGYIVKRASIVDMFPQTGHIEGVALLSFEKKKAGQRKPVSVNL
ncbi:MAG: class I SAM-dependent RNA methyltransferase [Thermodesulfobacteriota bacterium]